MCHMNSSSTSSNISSQNDSSKLKFVTVTESEKKLRSGLVMGHAPSPQRAEYKVTQIIILCQTVWHSTNLD